MTHAKVLTKLLLSVLFMLTVFLLTPAGGAAQSRDRESPTVVDSLPIRGNLGTGTYYYQIPEGLVSEGSASARLNFTPPDGGGSLTANFSGRRCCEGEPTLGESTGYSHDIGLNTTFTIPGRQDLLVTIDVAVAPKQTIRFSLAMAPAGSSVLIKPPRPELTPTTPGGVCTDLGVDFYVVNNLRGFTKKISGAVRNYTTTHPFKSYERGQWLQVFDITDSTRGPVRLLQVRIPKDMAPGAMFTYGAVHTPSDGRRRRYQIKIVYGAWLVRDRSEFNDDCNPANDTTETEMISSSPREERTIEAIEPVPRP